LATSIAAFFSLSLNRGKILPGSPSVAMHAVDIAGIPVCGHGAQVSRWDRLPARTGRCLAGRLKGGTKAPPGTAAQNGTSPCQHTTLAYNTDYGGRLARRQVGQTWAWARKRCGAFCDNARNVRPHGHETHQQQQGCTSVTASQPSHDTCDTEPASTAVVPAPRLLRSSVGRG
jgi:hypothetical protein